MVEYNEFKNIIKKKEYLHVPDMEELLKILLKILVDFAMIVLLKINNIKY